MKKISFLLALLLAAAFTFQSCEDNDDNAVPAHEFVWKGLNQYYLWQPLVPDLADDRFASTDQFDSFLQAHGTPENLFEHLLYQRNVVDRWSVIFSDFYVLENALQGVVKSNGVEFGLKYVPGSTTNIFGYVRYIQPGTDAAGQDIHRGDLFYAINGTPLTVDNYNGLLDNDTYTLNLADYNGGAITPNNRNITLTKVQYSENPVYSIKIVNEGSHKIGYLMYNGFFGNYDNELNAAFGQFAAAGVTDLVLDLRYNGGGSIRTASYLASMITGQFNGQLFSRQQWNPKMQAVYQSNNPGALQNLFTSQLSNGAAINHLNLNKVYVITTGSTASASELVINCLRPYIEVVTIGTTTTGKNVGSVTLYDSPDFTRHDINGSHRYAMQPIVLKVVNKENFGDYSTGLVPTYELPEDMGNLGVIGDINEPLFAEAIDRIMNSGRHGFRGPEREFRHFADSKSILRFGNEMYREDLP